MAVSLLLSFLFMTADAVGNPSGTVRVRVRNGAAPVASAEVRAGETVATTDTQGEARLTLPAGDQILSVARPGFAESTVPVTVRAEKESVVTVQLQEARLEEQVVVVSATRSGRIVQDQPVRVEVVPEEEIEENLTMAPGQLTTLLNELAGVRLQTTSPGLAGARLRLRGLSGRYTQVLLDGLPAFGEEPGAFGLLQMPPLDLAHVEILKGTAAALHGGSALGGLVNLVSRLPGSEPEVLVHQTSHGGTDAVGFLSHVFDPHLGGTLLGGGHRQRIEDLDGDGWADLPGTWRGELRPRLFWDDTTGHSLLAAAGATVEEREGGTPEGARTPAGTPFRERLHTEHYDLGLVGRWLFQGGRLLVVRGSAATTAHDRTFGEDADRERRDFGLVEATLTGTTRRHTWVLGTAFQLDRYHSRELPGFDFSHPTPALLAQDEVAVGEHLVLSGSARGDVDRDQGTLLSALLSALLRPAKDWSLRLSAGSGASAPAPFPDETDAIGLWRVRPPGDLAPERARTASLDLGWTHRGLEANASLFGSEVRDPLALRETPLEIVNAPGPTRTAGSELLARVARGSLQLIASYTYLRSTEVDPSSGSRVDVPLLPRHAGELAWIWEKESRGRIGLEVSYTGAQHLEHDPHRSVSPSYLEVEALSELRIGEARVFLNALNLTDVHQTHFDPLLLQERAPDGRWTTDVWAPLEGRVFNAGVRLEF